MGQRNIKVILSEEVEKFLETLSDDAQEKISYNIRRVMGGEINKELFKKLDNSDVIWEFRTLYRKIAYRLFAFWDTEQETLVITTHGIIKKTQKTPAKEIRRAEEIKKIYFHQKRKKE